MFVLKPKGKYSANYCNYKRFVENRIREMWDFHGVPISIFFRDKYMENLRKGKIFPYLCAENSVFV